MDNKQLLKNLEIGKFFEFLKSENDKNLLGGNYFDARGILIGHRQGNNLFHLDNVGGGGSVTNNFRNI